MIELKNKKQVMIFGAGQCWELYKKKLGNDIDIVKFIDNNKQLHNTLIDGIEVIPVDGIKKFLDKIDFIYIIADAKREIIKQLLEHKIGCEKIKCDFVGLDSDYDLHTDTTNKGNLVVSINGVKFELKNRTDYIVFNEIFLNEAYNYYSGYTNEIVIDIGMNAGLASLYFANRENVKKVYSFEPVKETFEKAVYNFNLNDDYLKNKIECFNYALGRKDETLVIPFDNENSGSTSIYDDVIGDENTTEIEVRGINRVLLNIFEINSDYNKILKLDCEGAEFDILSELDNSNILSQFNLILMEYHFGLNKKIETILKGNNFVYFSKCEWPNEKQGYIVAFNK